MQFQQPHLRDRK